MQRPHSQPGQTSPVITRSDELHARATGLIPACTQTLEKGPGRHVRGVAPKYLQRGKGSHVWDVDGNEFIDFEMAIGPVSLGYAYPAVDSAIRTQLADGITFSMMHPLEVEVAELIREVVPNAGMVRFWKTGSEAASAAVRLARAYTGRSEVLCCGSHGWHDWSVAATDWNRGVPQAVRNLTLTFNCNDIKSVLASIGRDVACVVLEPVTFEEPADDFLPRLREVCTERGVLLVYDEFWTGFRIALGGAQQHYGVNADLACFSSAVANGMPVSVLAGRYEIMRLLEREVYTFTTSGGEALSLAAAKATIHELREKQVPEALARQGRKLKDGYNDIARQLGMAYTSCVGMDCRTMVTFDASAGDPLEMKSLVQQELIRRGVLWGGFHTVCYSHSDEDISHALTAYREVLPILKRAVEDRNIRSYLRGEPIEPAFRRSGEPGLEQKTA